MTKKVQSGKAQKSVFRPECIKNIAAIDEMEKAKKLAAEVAGRKKVKNLYDTSVCARCGESQNPQVCEGGKCSHCGNGVIGTCEGPRWDDFSL